MSQKLALLSLLVPDYDAGISFFVTVMGWDLLEDTDLGDGKRWVRVAPKGAQTAFLLAKAVAAFGCSFKLTISQPITQLCPPRA